MKILISNDDGITAPGLEALYRAVSDMGEVSVVAPDSPQSAAGHSITLRHPLAVREVELGKEDKFTGLSVDGRPADCVRLAIRHLLPSPPDLVLSGINAGANAGVNVFYSGTVAAAVEASMCGVPAVAFSAASGEGEIDFQSAAKYCRWVLDKLLYKAGLTRGDLINVNIPQLDDHAPTGIRVVPQSTAELSDLYHKTEDADGNVTYQLGDSYDFIDTLEETDVHVLEQGLVTVTPLRMDMTNHEQLSAIGKVQWGKMPAIAEQGTAE